MNIALQYLPHYTYDDYVHWEGRWELIEGHPIAMSPMPVPKHQRVAGIIYVELELVIRKSKCKKCTVYQPLDYKVTDDTILQPDVLVTCRPVKKKFVDFPPVFVSEVFSPSTAMRDRNKKFELYQQQAIPYYLMVDGDKEIFYLYQLVEGQYKIVEHDFDKPYPFLFGDCKIEVRLNEVWENL